MKLVIVDTSVWIYHFKKSDTHLIELLSQGLVLMHPFVYLELYLGRPSKKNEIFDKLRVLPSVLTPNQSTMTKHIDKFHFNGIGLIDVSLIVSALEANAEIYTLDKKLKAQWLRARGTTHR
jgi:predicted nucleic acid-binding protein